MPGFKSDFFIDITTCQSYDLRFKHSNYFSRRESPAMPDACRHIVTTLTYWLFAVDIIATASFSTRHLCNTLRVTSTPWQALPLPFIVVIMAIIRAQWQSQVVNIRHAMFFYENTPTHWKRAPHIAMSYHADEAASDDYFWPYNTYQRQYAARMREFRWCLIRLLKVSLSEGRLLKWCLRIGLHISFEEPDFIKFPSL